MNQLLQFLKVKLPVFLLLLRVLREKNVTVIYISHRLDEIFEIGDYVTVMRDGKHIETKPVSQIQDRHGTYKNDDRENSI